MKSRRILVLALSILVAFALLSVSLVMAQTDPGESDLLADEAANGSPRFVVVEEVMAPGIEFTKTVGTDPLVCATEPTVVVGTNTDVTYCYEVRNSGDVTLTLHDLDDNETGSILSGFSFSLTPGSSFWLTDTVNITQTTVNTATWTAFNAGPTDVVSDVDTALVTVTAPDPLICNGPMIEFDEGIPSDWTVANNAPGNPVFWTDLAGCEESGNYATGDGNAACASSDLQGGGSGLYDTELWTQPFDLSGFDLVTLDYWANYGNFAGVDFLNLDISTDGGGSWSNLLSWNEDHHPNGLRNAPGENVTLDLSAYTAESNVILRWHYFDPSGPSTSDDWYAQFDEVSLSCAVGTASIEMTKTVGTDPMSCAPGDEITVDAGDDVYYCYEVMNTGTVTLTTHDLDDDQLGSIFAGLAYTLTPGASIDTVAAGLSISATLNTTTTNTATWTAANMAGFNATAVSSATVNVRTPSIGVTPNSLSNSQSPSIQTTHPLTISNLGQADLTWSIEEGEGATNLVWGEALANTPQAFNDAAPASRQLLTPLALGDELYQIDAGASTGSIVLLGMEFVDGYYWVTAAGLTTNSEQNYLFKLDISGTVVLSTVQPNTSLWGWRDLAYDGTYLYASDSAVLDQIDPATGLATGTTIPCPDNPCRALAYDPATDHFWTQNFGGPLNEFDRTGMVISTSSNGLAAYGAAWDAYSPGGPYVWIWSQDGPDSNQLVTATQIDPATGLPTGVSFLGTAFGIPGVDQNIAGGATISADVIPGVLTFIGLHQAPSDMIVGYEMIPCLTSDVPWLSANPISGTTSAGSSSVVDVTLDSTGLADGHYSANLCVESDDIDNPLVTVPVTLTVATVYGVDVDTAAAEMSGAPGDTLTYTVMVTNTGDTTDTFGLDAGGEMWTTGLETMTVTLGSGAGTAVEVYVSIPGDAGEGVTDTATISATSMTNVLATDMVDLTSTVQTGVNIYLPLIYREE